MKNEDNKKSTAKTTDKAKSKPAESKKGNNTTSKKTK